MISRRNIRLKVMQLIYMIETTHDDTPVVQPEQLLKKNLDKSRELFVYLLYFITEVALFAEEDSRHRRSKNLPSREDMQVNTKIAGNLTIWAILEHEDFKSSVEKDKPGLKMDAELLKKMYYLLAETPEYQAYIAIQSRDKNQDRDMIKFLFSQVLLPNESFCLHLEEFYPNWDDDGEMLEQLVMNYLHKPGVYNTREMVSEEKWFFARDLLRTTLEKKEFCSTLIHPKLKNWDADRIALLDMILMRMGLCELLFFETIPTKVTINEYIDLAKAYSTPQSGHFVNGILDNIHKELLEAGRINKIDHKNKG